MKLLSGRISKTAILLFSCLLLLLVPVSYAKDYDQVFSDANEAMGNGDLPAAITILKKVQFEKGDDGGAFVRSRMQIARLQFALKDMPAASATAREVLAVYPDNSEALNFIASVKQEQKPRYVVFIEDCLRFLPQLLKGAVMTIALVVCIILISPLGGLLIALGRISAFKPVSGLCWFFIWLFRGTPLLLQLFFIYYGLPSLGITFKPFTAAILGLGLNYSAYLGEIIRGGIQSIEHGQMEAAKAIGMTYWQAMRRVIIPQTYKRLMPPIGNEFIALIKDTALVSTIAMVELMRSADQMFNAYFNVTALILAALIYLLFTTIFTFIFEKIEIRAGIYENR
ncbi:MAG TPA: amino acid ABC transporter permease [Geobacter sp.]|nr:amino acid ABC transporter permease [Geobacter sp.]